MENIAESKVCLRQSGEEMAAIESDPAPIHNPTQTVITENFEQNALVGDSEQDGVLKSSKTVTEKTELANNLADALKGLNIPDGTKLLDVQQNPLNAKENLLDDYDLKLHQNEKFPHTIKLEQTNQDQEIKTHENWFTIHPLLEEYKECFFNWIPDENPLTLEEADIVLQVITDHCRRPVDNLNFFPVKAISQHLTMSFCCLFQSKLVEANKYLNEVEELINSAAASMLISDNNKQGFMYLLTGLEALKKSLVVNSASPGKETAEALKDLELVAKSKKFEELPKLAQVLIKGVKAVFFGSRRLISEETKLLKEVITEDPDSVEWLTYLFVVSRECRRRESTWNDPSEDETQSLLRAIALDDKHVMVKLYRCIYLSDAIKSWEWRNILRNFQEFTSIEEVVNFIKTEAKEILMMDGCKNNRIILTIADIFGFTLRYKNGDFRDVPLAKKCLQDALTNNPKSSRANHKMGLLLLTTETKLDEAREFFKEALACDPRNFSALIDVVHVLLNKPTENAEELCKIFHDQIKPKIWSQRRLVDLIYLQGIHHYMLGEKAAAVKAWIVMYQTDLDKTHITDLFKKLTGTSDRYLWDRQIVSVTNFYNHFLQIVSSKGSSLNPIPNEQELEIIVKLFEVLKSIKPAKYQSVNKAFKGESSSSLHSGAQRRGPK